MNTAPEQVLYWPCLSDPVAAVLGLLVVVRVEVDVMQDDDVGGGEVDAQPPGPGGQQEHVDLFVIVELVYQLLSETQQQTRVYTHKVT